MSDKIWIVHNTSKNGLTVKKIICASHEEAYNIVVERIKKGYRSYIQGQYTKEEIKDGWVP